MGGRKKGALWLAAWLVVVTALVAPTVAIGAFPGSDPAESVRANAPNDPGFDACEPDNAGGQSCTTIFSEEYQRFGFAPAATQFTATYHDASAAARQIAQNRAAGRNALGQVAGISADRAWKFSTGDPGVKIGITDTGIKWQDPELRTKVALNRRELPLPRRADGSTCFVYDCNGDGVFNVDDYAGDARVSKKAGDDPADAVLDASDLIHTFSDGRDADHNGYVDDIAGWDFFTNDNDPEDASSYYSGAGHGTGRMKEAAAATNDGVGPTGVCPRCMVVPLRDADSITPNMNNWGQAVVYAADNGIAVVGSAIGGLFNSRYARLAMRYAYAHGVFFAVVSSDTNSASHNIPTNYDESMMVGCTIPDTYGLGFDAPALAGVLGGLGIPLGTTVPVSTYFRNAGVSQYGGHADVVAVGPTGSQCTGQMSGAAGLLAAYGRQRGLDLRPNEIKQLLTLTAEDVLPANTGGLGTADPSQPGWDQHFGYGRPDLGLAMERIRDRRIPPQALITAPDWFEPFNVLRRSVAVVRARLSARAATYRWSLQWAPGIEPLEGDFREVANGSGSAPIERAVGAIDLLAVRAALDARPGGGATRDPTAPGKGPGDRDPNEPAFTVRVVVTDAGGNRGEDRKVLFAYRDASLAPGWARRLGTGGEASPRLYDLDGDNRLDVVIADSSGELRVLRANGSRLRSFNRGRSVRTRVQMGFHGGAPGARHLPAPREVLRTPAIGDVDGDRVPDIVDAAGEHVYAWHADGRPLKGFPVRLDPAFSRPRDLSTHNHLKRGFTASPTLADLNGDGRLDIVEPALDQHVYAWDGRGRPLAGFPVKLKSPGLDGAEIFSDAAVGDITGDGKPEIVVPTNEVGNVDESLELTGPDAIGTLVTHLLGSAIGGSGRIYAIDRHGHVLPGWPLKPASILPTLLPLVGGGVSQALGDVNGDGRLDVVGGMWTSEERASDGRGRRLATYDSQPLTGEAVDKLKVLNLTEQPIVANLDGRPGLEVIKGGITASGALNLLLAGQNFPYNHLLQVWNGRSGASLPAFPQAVEDYQFVSSPTVADVSDAPGREVLYGTGLYLLRDINAAGVEGRGWPKFTGGWLYAIPAIGDVDGDGKLDVVALTREGFAFLWRTDRPACGGNAEWWTARHDEFGSGAYGTDSRPPGTPMDLRAARAGTQLSLRWRAPGDDWLCGRARRYEVRVSRRPLRRPADGARVLTGDAAQAGEGETALLRAPRGARYAAVIYEDDAGNWGHLAGVRLPR